MCTSSDSTSLIALARIAAVVRQLCNKKCSNRRGGLHINLEQGSAEWLEHRKHYRNASEKDSS